MCAGKGNLHNNFEEKDMGDVGSVGNLNNADESQDRFLSEV